MRKPTPTEKRIDELKGEITRLEKDIAAEIAGGNSFTVDAGMQADLADMRKRLKTQEDFAAKARKRNASARARGNAMTGLGMKRTAGGWE